MNLDQLQQEVKELEKMNISQMTPEQLTLFFEKLSSILEKSEVSFINNTILEQQNNQNKIEENDKSNNS